MNNTYNKIILTDYAQLPKHIKTVTDCVYCICKVYTESEKKNIIKNKIK